jgi:crossover junction endodeoxyribonuclease RuvC
MMAIILGIDPGSRLTGYGVIRIEGTQHHYLASGCVRVHDESLPHRLQQIYNGLKEIIHCYQPTEMAIEQVFMHQNPGAALKLGQARGAAIVATAATAIPVAEYSARQIKQSVVGYGAAKKEQVQHMVCRLLNLSGTPQADAADALAVALCHAQSRQGLVQIVASQTASRGRFRRGRFRLEDLPTSKKTTEPLHYPTSTLKELMSS